MDKSTKPNTLMLSVVIPCFNEAKNIRIVLEKLDMILKETDHLIEIIVVDGGSTDDTVLVLKEMFKTLDKNKFSCLLQEKGKGYGGDILDALSQAKGDVLSWTHADLQTDPYDIITAFEMYLSLYKSKEVFIKGRRRNRPLLDVFFTFGMQVVTFFLLKVYLHDINAQPKLFSRQFYEKYIKEKGPNDFSLDLFLLYQARKNALSIQSFPVYFHKRIYGEAKGGGGSWKNKFKLIRRTFRYVFELKRDYIR
jgi:glycosyltransferase involved in cell wall biosynthesis